MAVTTLTVKGQVVIPAALRKKLKIQQGTRLHVEEKNGKIFFAMKNTQSHDSCFSAETLEQNYGWKIEDVGYFQKVMGNTYFPK